MIRTFPTLTLFVLGWALLSVAHAAEPVLCFSDLVSGPRTGNSDTSLGQPAGQDGAIVTIWGKDLGDAQGASTIFANGAEARVYSWGNATPPAAPADLHKRLGMQMVCFQINHAAKDGAGEIYVQIDNSKSNSLPFTVRDGRVLFVKTSGDDAGAGDWASPWKTVAHAVRKSVPGDIIYLCDGITHTTQDSYNAAVNLDSDGEPARPKAIVAYPGAKCLIGAETIDRGFGHWVPGKGHTADHWTIAKLRVTAKTIPILLGSGYRVVGNYVTAPVGSAPEGAIEGSGNILRVLGNEIAHVGKPGCSKLYHPIYISSQRASTGPRRPAESDREIAWNYIHDNNANRGINIYSERPSTAYMSGHRVHDNYIADQVGDGILIGQYTTGENWVYNNIVTHCGLGPDPDPRESEATTHFGVSIDAGIDTFQGTLIHFYNNTIYDCGWAQAKGAGATGAVQIYRSSRYTLDFSNNIIVSTGQPYVSGWSDKKITVEKGRNLWFGKGAAPPWNPAGISEDPRFVDPANGDFHLKPGSPAIDTGMGARQ